MKRSLLLLCILAIATFIGATTLSVSGTLPGGAYQLAVEGPRAALLFKDMNISNASISLSEHTSLGVATRRLNAFFTTQGSRQVRAVSLVHTHFALHLLTDVADRLGATVVLPSLTIGLLPSLQKNGGHTPFFEQYTVVGRWVASTQKAKMEVESSFTLAEGLSLYKQITLTMRPITVTVASGPTAGVREAAFSVRAHSNGVRAFLCFSQRLGNRPLYSGSYQEASRQIESEIGYTFKKHTIVLGHQVTLHCDAAAKAERAERWSLSYSNQTSQLTCSYSSDGFVLTSKEGRHKLNIGDNEITASWVYKRLPWRFEVQVGPKKQCSLLWQFTSSTDRDS